MVDVVDRSTQWYFSSATSSKPAPRADAREGRLEPGQALERGVGADELVVVEHRDAVEVLDRDDGLGEVAVGPGLGGAVVRLGGVRVDVARACQPSSVAIRSAPMPCGTKPVVERGGRVHRPGAAVGAHRHPAHRLDAAGEDQVLEAGADLRAAAWLTASSPEAQKRLSCTPATVSGKPAASAAVLAMSPPCSPIGETHAEHDVVDAARVEARGCGRCSSSSRPTTRSTGFTSCREPTALPLPRGVRDGVVDECFGHAAVLMGPIVTLLLSW